MSLTLEQPASLVSATDQPAPARSSRRNLRPEQLNAALQPYARSLAILPLAIFCADLGLYLLTLFCAIVAENLCVQTLCALIAGLEIGILFIIGHDSCHGSFLKHKILNQIVGRLAFLPSLHPFSLQYVWHNRTHHRYTNYTGKDFLFAPLSKAEFDALTPARKRLYRLYRSGLGHGIYYLYEIWWKKMIVYRRSELGSIPAHFWDRLMVGVWACVWIAFLGALPSLVHGLGFPSLVPWRTVLFGFIIPYLMWNWIMGFLIYQHHTHPAVAWFDDIHEWDYLHAQIDGTVHVRFPQVYNLVLHNIMEHTAHHAQTQIPLYRLKAAQTELERRSANRLIIVDWTWEKYFQTLRDCKLYDYRTHHWLDFSGKRTSPCTIENPVCGSG